MFQLPAALLVLVGSCFGQWDPHVTNGQVIVQLFEWPWNDIARECESFLGPKGFGGVQVSSPTENMVIPKRTWGERYFPVSYKLTTRSGDEDAFKDMVSRCNTTGVRIYVDTVINQMTRVWQTGKVGTDGLTVGTGGSTFHSASQSYPAVPYSSQDFNDAICTSPSGSIDDSSSIDQIRNCKHKGLNDLNLKSDYVQEKILKHMNKLISFGVAGFRVEGCEYMWPEDLKNIFDRLHDLNTDYFKANSRPFILQVHCKEIPEYVGNGRVTEFRYGEFLSDAFLDWRMLMSFRNFGEEWGMADRQNVIVYIDDYSSQRGLSKKVVTFRNEKWYKMANAFMLAWPYGFTRLMSSYYWEQRFVGGYDKNLGFGPPMDSEENIVGPTIFANGTCGGGWICEHRWPQITNMVEFRNVVHGTNVSNWWDNNNNQIAFCRGDRGFIALNNEKSDLKQTLQTCLQAGTYCDVISGSKQDGSCTGKSVMVNVDGTATIEIAITDTHGTFAIHAQSKV